MQDNALIPIKGRRICLIGGAGFIGHNLALQLKELGAEVSVVDGLEVNNLLAFKAAQHVEPNTSVYVKMLDQRLELLRSADIPLFVQDARDYHVLSRVLGEIDPQVIVQLAAVAHANQSNKDPFSTFDHSLRTLENALDIARSPHCSVEHFIYFSSSMVYGHFEGGEVTEESVCNPLGIYGALKFSGEKLIIAYNQAFDLPYTILRPSALYGERCVSRRVGQIFIENALAGKEITIAGDGSARLDFTYIRDLVDGIIKVVVNPSSRNEIFNLTYGDSRSLADMAVLMEKYFPEAKITYIPKDKLTPDRGTLSVKKAERLIGYKPEWPLEKGFINYIDWYQSAWQTLSS